MITNRSANLPASIEPTSSLHRSVFAGLVVTISTNSLSSGGFCLIELMTGLTGDAEIRNKIAVARMLLRAAKRNIRDLQFIEKIA